jgi:FKBP-type peptidyl-prolyl cis-trans isomerase FkpA
MRRSALCLMILLVAPLAAEGEAPPVVVQAPPATEQQLKDGAYFIAWQIGQQLSRQHEEMAAILANADQEALLAGLRDGANGQRPARDEQTAQAAVTAFLAQIEAAEKDKHAATIAAGEAHLASLKGKAGVVFLPSGMAYEVIKEGTGAHPKATDTVRVLYTGTLTDGQVFDSTAKRNNEPTEFPLNGVITGWTQGIQLMTVGSTYRFHIPANLAYRGERKGIIAPHSLLIFEVELLGIVGG